MGYREAGLKSGERKQDKLAVRKQAQKLNSSIDRHERIFPASVELLVSLISKQQRKGLHLTVPYALIMRGMSNDYEDLH